MAWTPLFDGERANRARAAVGEIAESLDGELPDLGVDLARGRAGIALFFHYLSIAFPDARWDAARRARIDEVIELAATAPLDGSLHAGVAGIAWVVQHAGEASDDQSALDALLERHIARSSQVADLVAGCVGIGVHACERLPQPSARHLLEHVVARLCDTAEHDDDGAFWIARPAHASAIRGRNYVDLGLAHGVAGAIALLSRALEAGVAMCEPLLRDTVRWLVAHRSTGGHYAFAVGDVDEQMRCGWCYGDAGVGTALLAAGHPSAREVLAQVAHTTASDARVVDAGLCHGAAGLGHLLNRAWHRTDDTVLLAGARRWLADALDRRRPGEGVAGWRAVTAHASGAASYGFLNGAAGIGLALIAATSPVEPAWDRALLL